MARRIRTFAASLALLVGVSLIPVPATAGGWPSAGPYTPGAAGVGDPYFPLDGNGGYDVVHYDLDLRYDPTSGDPATRPLSGRAVIVARATQNLSTFNLDLVGLEVRSIQVNGRSASWSRDGQELTVEPSRGLRKHRLFVVVVRYDGPPTNISDVDNVQGFVPTDDGALVIGQPDVAATWFPVNDHPVDKASYEFHIAVPDGVEAIANGTLRRTTSRGGWTTWHWSQPAPMASYLATATIGQFDVSQYRADGIEYVDALDVDLSAPPVSPPTGEFFAMSGAGDSAYRRLSRTIQVPAAGAQMSFWVSRDTEPLWDYFFVEAHTVGADDWTTLPDANGHTDAGTGESCPDWLGLHPFLLHYQTANEDGSCSPTGLTGGWNAASGGTPPEQWLVDLTPYAGSAVEVSFSYATDASVQFRGVLVDDVQVSTGEGTTSFEADGDQFDGWTMPGPPVDSPPATGDWTAATAADVPIIGDLIRSVFARQPEILDFLSDSFGRYPFRAAGGIVDDVAELGYALETQTRPIYALGFFSTQLSGEFVVVHELAHQWFGDSVSIALWSDIWLNEGFSTYAEWLWGEREGIATAQEFFDFNYSRPADDQFWTIEIGDPGPANLFDLAVYDRGAMTLHQLRLLIGDDVFFDLLTTWARRNAGSSVTTEKFIALAERKSGRQLDAFFQTWLFTPEKPVVEDAAASAAGAAAPAAPPGVVHKALAPRR